MNKAEAIEKIGNSLSSEEAKVITPKGEIYEEYVDKLASQLMGCIIEPVKVNVTSSCAQEGSFELYKKSMVWAVARNRDNWLLTIEGQKEFALGFGEHPNNIMMHGFSSPDALGEWCA